MDGRRFDSLALALARRASRRSALKTLFGLGGSIGAAATMRGDAAAARRGFSGPRWHNCPPGAIRMGGACQCADQRTPCLSGDTGQLVSCCQSGEICCFDGSCIPPDQICAF